jgi:hypothetical protein
MYVCVARARHTHTVSLDAKSEGVEVVNVWRERVREGRHGYEAALFVEVCESV